MNVRSHFKDSETNNNGAHRPKMLATIYTRNEQKLLTQHTVAHTHTLSHILACIGTYISQQIRKYIIFFEFNMSMTYITFSIFVVLYIFGVCVCSRDLSLKHYDEMILQKFDCKRCIRESIHVRIVYVQIVLFSGVDFFLSSVALQCKYQNRTIANDCTQNDD